MIVFFSPLVRLLKALVGAWRRDPQFRSLVVLVFFTLLSGTIFYSLQEGWSIVDAFYFSVTTLSTVGLSDLALTTTVGKLFTVFYILAGLSLILGFIETLAKETLRSRTRRGGNGEVRVIGIFSEETFAFAPESVKAPQVDNQDAEKNPAFDPVHTLHLGLWFADPEEAKDAGCSGKVTPFDGDHEAGIQALSTRNFPKLEGPLGKIK